MTAPVAQYEHIGSKYDEYARTATLKRAERYTFFRMVGALHGKHALDLACGFGFYTRLLKQHGAAQVIGVDISPEMIRLAHQQEQTEPLGITYQVGDAVALPPLGPFDLVTAINLLNYATTKDQMRGMFRRVYDSLVAGASSPPPSTRRSPSVSPTARRTASPCCARHRRRTGTCATLSSSPSRRPLSATSSGVRAPMSGPSRRPGSGSSPGTPRRWRRKTSRTTGKRIGAISTTIAS